MWTLTTYVPFVSFFDYVDDMVIPPSDTLLAESPRSYFPIYIGKIKATPLILAYISQYVALIPCIFYRFTDDLFAVTQTYRVGSLCVYQRRSLLKGLDSCVLRTTKKLGYCLTCDNQD